MAVDDEPAGRVPVKALEFDVARVGPGTQMGGGRSALAAGRVRRVDDDDLANIWDENLETEDDGFDIDKELAKITKPKTKLGDIYQLGIHRLICGDSTDPTVLKKLIGNSQVSMIYSDPVYNIRYHPD